MRASFPHGVTKTNFAEEKRTAARDPINRESEDWDSKLGFTKDGMTRKCIDAEAGVPSRLLIACTRVLNIKKRNEQINSCKYFVVKRVAFENGFRILHADMAFKRNMATNPRLKQGTLLFVLSTMLGVLFAIQSYLGDSQSNQPVNWSQLFINFLSLWYIWALMYPLILWVSRRFPLERGYWKRSLAVHIPALVIFPITHLLCYSVLLHSLGTVEEGLGMTIEYLFRRGFAFRVITYGLLLAISYSVDYYQKFRERELSASRFEARLAEARLQVLTMQLQPHFLFNTLHAISSLMHKNVEAADEMIARLGELLRVTLESDGVQEVPLKQELDILQHYLDIEKIRLGDRLTVHLEIQPEMYTVSVPNLILQPIVENAIRYGMATRPAGGTLEIKASESDGMLRISISDNGPGMSSSIREGIGLTNTRTRLQQLYGSRQRFSLTSEASRGTTVTLEIPLRNDWYEPDSRSLQTPSDDPNVDRG